MGMGDLLGDAPRKLVGHPIDQCAQLQDLYLEHRGSPRDFVRPDYP